MLRNGNKIKNISCSIVIPTYNRPSYLRRILDYYIRETGYNIVVADSSSIEKKKLNRRILGETAERPNITYLDKYPSEINPYHKIADALSHINTQYCVLCPDDDLITPNGINQSVDFLEKNQDFTVAHGYYIDYYLKTDERKKEQFCWAPIYSHESISFLDPKSRLSHHLSNYSQLTLWGVHRTDFLRMIFEETLKFTSDDRFGELLLSSLTLIYGKMKCLDVLYAARESIPGSWGRRAKTFRDSIKDNTYNEKYANFRDCLSRHLSKQSQLDVEESKKVIDNAMSAYMKKYHSNDYKHILINKMSDILDYLPDWMNERIRALYRKLFLLRQVGDSLISMETSPSSDYYEDFNKIRVHVLSYSK